MNLEQLQQWVQSTYGRRLNDSELNQLLEVVGYQGGQLSPELFQQAQEAVAQAATDAGIVSVADAAPSGEAVSGTLPVDQPQRVEGTPEEMGVGDGEGGVREAVTRPSEPVNALVPGAGAVSAPAVRAEAPVSSPAMAPAMTPMAEMPPSAASAPPTAPQAASPAAPGSDQYVPPQYLPTFAYGGFGFEEAAPTAYQPGAVFAPERFAFAEQGPGAFQYAAFVPPTAESVTQDPAYQRRLAEGRKALETSAASKGLLRTGATLKSLSDYAQQQASDEYARAYQRQLGEYQMGRAGAKEEYEAGRQSYLDRYNRAYQEYLTNLENQRFGYSTAEQQRRQASEDAQREYERKYRMAQDKYQTGYNKAFAEYQSQRSAAERQYEQDWNYWKYLQDDAFRRAQLQANLAQ